jgi:hypothetical protein
MAHIPAEKLYMFLSVSGNDSDVFFIDPVPPVLFFRFNALYGERIRDYLAPLIYSADLPISQHLHQNIPQGR